MSATSSSTGSGVGRCRSTSVGRSPPAARRGSGVDAGAGPRTGGDCPRPRAVPGAGRRVVPGRSAADAGSGRPGSPAGSAGGRPAGRPRRAAAAAGTRARGHVGTWARRTTRGSGAGCCARRRTRRRVRGRRRRGRGPGRPSPGSVRPRPDSARCTRSSAPTSSGLAAGTGWAELGSGWSYSRSCRRAGPPTSHHRRSGCSSGASG